jgi:hypothetical protein
VADDKCCARGPDEGYTDRWNNARNPGVNKPAPSLEPAITPKVDLSRPIKKGPEMTGVSLSGGRPIASMTTAEVDTGNKRIEAAANPSADQDVRARMGEVKFEPIGYAKGGYTQRWSKARGK